MISKSKIKYLRSLKFKKYRKKHGVFLIEGTRIITSALETGFFLKTVFMTEYFKNYNSSHPVMEKIKKEEVPLKIIDEKTMTSIADTEHPSGVAAVCSLPKFHNNLIKSEHPFLFLDTISDPGNLGTIFRSASWFGIQNIALSTHCVDPFNSKSVRAGMGAHFNLNIYENITLETFSEKCFWIIGADSSGTSNRNWKKQPKKESWVLVLGSEANGISEENQALLNETITIPKYGIGESLNVATSAAILLSHLVRSDIN